MVTFPGAKINIGLRITGKRRDGFHNIETIFCPIPLHDALEFVVAANQKKGDSLIITGIEIGGAPEDNLVMKAVTKLREKYNFPYLKMHLHKTIPLGAGLGGGSSDAAAILKGINRCHGLNLTNDRLKKIALEIGSDCPFFIEPVLSFAKGRGEKLVACKKQLITSQYLVILNPGINISTREAYLNTRPAGKTESIESLVEKNPADRWKDIILNDFEEYVFRQHPEIGELKRDLYNSGAIFSLMSGSGSSVYGIFNARTILPERLRSYIVWQGFIRPQLPYR